MFRSAFTRAKRLSVAAITAFIVVACQASKPPVSPGKEIHLPTYVITTYHGDVSFNDVDKDIIEKSAVELYEQTSGLLRVNVVYDLDFDNTQSVVRLGNNNMLIRIMSKMGPVVKQDEGLENGNVTLGWVDTNLVSYDPMQPKHVFLVYDRLTSKLMFQHVVMHEILHSEGIRHVSDKAALMYYKAGTFPPDCIIESDAKEICRVYSCDANQLNFCR